MTLSANDKDMLIRELLRKKEENAREGRRIDEELKKLREA